MSEGEAMESIKTPLSRESAQEIVARIAYNDRLAASQVVDLLLAVDAASRKQAQEERDRERRVTDEAIRRETAATARANEYWAALQDARQAQEPLVEALRYALQALDRFSSVFNNDNFTDRYGDGEVADRAIQLCAAALKSAEQSSSVETGK